MTHTIHRMPHTDILIIGAGLAGIKAAHVCSRSGLDVTIMAQDRLCSGSSFYPLMEALAFQATADRPGDLDDFVQEMSESGAGMNDPGLCRIYAHRIREQIGEMPLIGIECKKMQSDKLACFAKRKRDIYYWEDWAKIRSNVYRLVENNQIHLLEYTSVISLCKHNGRIAGVLCCGREGDIGFIKAKAVILATGGFGDIYKHNLNTPDVGGDGHILALDAGAKLINMEFMQFIPGFMSPVYKVVFREGSLIYCDGLYNQDGTDILKKHLPPSISKEACIIDRATHGPFTTARISKYVDIAIMKEIKNGSDNGVAVRYRNEILKDQRDNIKLYVDWLKDEKGVDITRDDIFIAPFYQASNGGIWIDAGCRTGIDGLFCAGEAAGGIHGADRHGGNASGSCLVFGKIAAQSAVTYARKENNSVDAIDKEIESLLYQTLKRYKGVGIDARDVIETVRETMWRCGNVIRNEEDLMQGLNTLRALKEKYNTAYAIRKTHVRTAIRAGHFIDLAYILLHAMLMRRESRGPHYREDYPNQDEQYDKRLTIWNDTSGTIHSEFISQEENNDCSK